MSSIDFPGRTTDRCSFPRQSPLLLCTSPLPPSPLLRSPVAADLAGHPSPLRRLPQATALANRLSLLFPFAADYRNVKDTMNNASVGPSFKARVGSSQPSETSFKRKRGVFQKDLQHMMYGFGDDSNPLPETVALVEDIVVEYVTDMAHKAQDIASKRGKLLTEDFLFLIRKDLPKLNRCTELLSMNEELKQARKAFDVDEDKLAQAE